MFTERPLTQHRSTVCNLIWCHYLAPVKANFKETIGFLNMHWQLLGFFFISEATKPAISYMSIHVLSGIDEEQHQ